MPPEADQATAVPHAGTGMVHATGRTRLAWWLIGGVIVADQVTKWLVLTSIPLFGSITVIPNIVDFVHIQNAGVAFGIMNEVDSPWRGAVTMGLALAALAGIVYYSRHMRPDERLARIGLSLILGGAAGNLIDRFRFGHVVDFIDVYHGDWHFWAFNVADASISCGAVLIFLELFFPSRHASHPV